jgi:hypothetical protein
MKKSVVNEVNEIKKMMGLNEQYHTLPTDTIARKSTIMGATINPTTPTNLLYLTPRDESGNVVGEKLTYSISGKYSYLGSFDITMRNIKRLSNGNLYAEVKPDNNLAYGAMTKLIPDDKLTADKWLNVTVPNKKINTAINQLKNSSSAEIDAGFGVSITLKNV